VVWPNKKLRAAVALARGQAALGGAEVEEAVVAFEAALDLRPRWAQARMWLASALSDLGDLQGAKAQISQVLELAPDSAVAHLWIGRILLDHGELEGASESLAKARSCDSKNLHVGSYESLVALSLGELHEDALKGLESVLRPGGNELWGRWLLAIEEAMPGGPGTDFHGGPRRPRGPLQRLAAKRSAGKATKAAALVVAAKKELPREEGEEAFAVSRAFVMLARAQVLLDDAEMLWPAEEGAIEVRRDAHLAGGQAGEILLETEPEDLDLRLQTTLDHIEIGACRKALRILSPIDEQIAGRKGNPIAWLAPALVLRGRALIGLERLEEAREVLTRAVDLLPVAVEPLYDLGVACLREGDRLAARRSFIGVCELDESLVATRARELIAATG